MAEKCCAEVDWLIGFAVLRFTLRMSPPPLHVLTEAEKNELLLARHEMIERLVARISELESLVGTPRNTSRNSHIPPSKDDFGKRGGKGGKPKTGKRPPREGKHRPLTETPDKTERIMAANCCHCGTDISSQAQHCRHRYDHIDLPPIRPIVTRIACFAKSRTVVSLNRGQAF